MPNIIVSLSRQAINPKVEIGNILVQFKTEERSHSGGQEEEEEEEEKERKEGEEEEVSSTGSHKIASFRRV